MPLVLWSVQSAFQESIFLACFIRPGRKMRRRLHRGANRLGAGITHFVDLVVFLVEVFDPNVFLQDVAAAHDLDLAFMLERKLRGERARDLPVGGFFAFCAAAPVLQYVPELDRVEVVGITVAAKNPVPICRIRAFPLPDRKSVV